MKTSVSVNVLVNSRAHESDLRVVGPLCEATLCHPAARIVSEALLPVSCGSRSVFRIKAKAFFTRLEVCCYN